MFDSYMEHFKFKTNKMKEKPTSLSNKKKILGIYLNSMKKMLPSNCTYLSLMKRSNGEIVIRSVVNKVDYLFSIPQDFSLTEADLNRIHRLLIEKCSPNVEEGN